jgi:hypothetical protein
MSPILAEGSCQYFSQRSEPLMSRVLNFRKAAIDSVGYFANTKKHSINTVQECQYAQLNKALTISNIYFQISSQRKRQEEALTNFRECCERKSLL